MRLSKSNVDWLRSGALEAMSLPSEPWQREHFIVYARLTLAFEGGFTFSFFTGVSVPPHAAITRATAVAAASAGSKKRAGGKEKGAKKVAKKPPRDFRRTDRNRDNREATLQLVKDHVQRALLLLKS